MKPTFDLSGQTILVAGSSGFLGSHLCRVLCATKNEIHGISRYPDTQSPDLQWWQGDLADISVARKLLSTIEPDIIFHLITHGWGARGLEHVLPTLHNDLVATVNVLTVATELKIHRLILTGSLEEPAPGDAEAFPSSPYAAAKWACGAYARMFHRLYQTPAVIVRIFMTYGPGQPSKKIIPYVISSLLKEESPSLSSGQRLIDWVYVDDVIEGLLAAARVNDIEGRTLDLGSGTLVSIQQVVEHLIRMTGPPLRPQFGALPDRPLEQVRAANTQDTYDRLGWRIKTPLEKGLELTVKWYREQLQNNRRPATDEGKFQT